VNREWHREHKMPEGATVAQRIEWHLVHARHCACRPFPKGLLVKLDEEQRRQVMREVEPQLSH
jgi:hypothetical protein